MNQQPGQIITEQKFQSQQHHQQHIQYSTNGQPNVGQMGRLDQTTGQAAFTMGQSSGQSGPGLLMTGKNTTGQQSGGQHISGQQTSGQQSVQQTSGVQSVGQTSTSPGKLAPSP